MGVDPSDLSIALTPKQIIGGFALLAALVMLLRRRKPDRRRD
jgi:MYXO-CTERM domain-containing protein